MKKLTMDQVNAIEYLGRVEIDGEVYTYKDYEYKSEIWKNGELIARIDNKKDVNDQSRVEYVEGKPERPHVENGTGWIPVTERLPETPGPTEWPKYLVCYANGRIDTQYWADGWNCTRDRDGVVDRTHEIKDIVAWMPLPEPYKEG